MSLFDKFLPKKEGRDYLLTLGVEEYKIQAAIVRIDGNKASIIGVGETDFPEGENEVEAADIAISTAEKNLEENLLVEKTIFALPQFYLENDNVKHECLAKLKKITKELQLKPHGFIDYPQSLSFYLEKEEGSPPTLLLISLGRNRLTFSLIRVGKVQQNIVIERSSSLLSDFEEALPQFSAEIMPSRIIIYDESEKIEDIQEELLRFPWNKHPSFLHTPKIEIFPRDKIIIAVAEAAATSLLKKIQFEEKEEKEETKEEMPTKEEMISAKKEEELPTLKYKEKPEDIKPYEEKHHLEEKYHEADQPLYETFGFVKSHHEAHVEKDFKEDKKSLKLPALKFSFIASLFSFSLLPVVIFIIIALITVLSYLFWFYPKAAVYLIVYPLVSTQTTEVTLATSDKSEADKNMIRARLISEEVSGEKTASTSGKTRIGEKARGEVTIYNKTTNSKTFPKGTVIQNKDIKFTLDSDVNIASASDTGEGLSFGKVVAKVTASSIGPEGNIGNGNIFNFKDFPETSYIAKSSQSFSGGTSREVSSISQNDQERLETALTNELIVKAKQQLAVKLASGEKLLDSSQEKKISSKKFSGSVGSEAQQISLSLTVKLNILSFNETDLINIAKNRLDSPPSGFTLDSQKTAVKVEDVKLDKNNNYKVKASVTAYFLPEVNTEEIRSKITGQKYQSVSSYLSKVANIGGVKIVQENHPPFFGQRLPSKRQNILVQVISF